MTRHQLFHVPRCGALDDMAGGMARDVDFLQARDIHQPRLRADRHVFGIRVALGIGPGRAHPAPVFEVGPEGAVAGRSASETPEFVICGP